MTVPRHLDIDAAEVHQLGDEAGLPRGRGGGDHDLRPPGLGLLLADPAPAEGGVGLMRALKLVPRNCVVPLLVVVGRSKGNGESAFSVR